MSTLWRGLLGLGVSCLVVSPLWAADIGGEVRTSARPGLDKPATVQLLDGEQVIVEQNTDLDGHFEFHNVLAKTYTLRVRSRGYNDVEVPVIILAANSDTRIPVTLRSLETQSDAPTGNATTAEMNIPRSARKEYESGLSSHRRKDCARATVHLQKAISLYDKYGDAYYELGNCSREMGRLSEAESFFLKAIQYSASVYPSINLADLYASTNRVSDATTVIQQALRKNPVEGDLYFALSKIYFDQGRLREAEAAALEAHARVHRAADVHLLLAKLYLKTENYPALRTQLETYLDESPTGPIADQVRQNLEQLRHSR